MAFTNTSPLTYPTRSAVPATGTNPLCLAAAGTDGDSFVLDMATTTVALGKVRRCGEINAQVEIASRKGQPVPSTWGVAEGGEVTDDPQKILHGGGLLPIGGTEEAGLASFSRGRSQAATKVMALESWWRSSAGFSAGRTGDQMSGHGSVPRRMRIWDSASSPLTRKPSLPDSIFGFKSSLTRFVDCRRFGAHPL